MSPRNKKQYLRWLPGGVKGQGVFVTDGEIIRYAEAGSFAMCMEPGLCPQCRAFIRQKWRDILAAKITGVLDEHPKG
jgi:hypothetical protein